MPTGAGVISAAQHGLAITSRGRTFAVFTNLVVSTSRKCAPQRKRAITTAQNHATALAVAAIYAVALRVPRANGEGSDMHRPTNRRCVYCGRQTKLSLACGYHRDLLRLDPHYKGVPRV